MGYLIVPDITKEEVVCQSPCVHKDCKLNREEWTNATCFKCGQKLQAGDWFYYESIKPRRHLCFDCAYDEREKITK